MGKAVAIENIEEMRLRADIDDVRDAQRHAVVRSLTT
jgi:hypothetical protein